MKKSNVRKTNLLLKLGFCFILLLFISVGITNKSYAESDFYYLSDIEYDKSSKTAWGSILKDKTSSGSKISVKVEGAYYTFEKGMWAHATSTLIYDLREYDYDYFTAYIGLNQTAASSSNGVKFYIYTSADGSNWNLKTAENPAVKKAGENATFVKIDIRTEKYLKLVANDNGANGNDHSVYADAKLIKATYKEPGEDLVPSIEELDNKIKNEFANADIETNKDFEHTLLKRDLISNVGNYALRKYLSASEDNKKVYEWLTSDLDNLRLFVLGGTPDGGSYYNALTELSRLYKEYKDDFDNTELTNNTWYPDLTKGEVYKKMAVALALTHSTACGYWAQINHPSNRSDALKRYEIYKYLYDNGKFVVSSRQDHTPWFEALTVEEMRYVMNNITDNEELIWLNEYTQKRIDAHPNQEEKYLQPHTYIAYVWPDFQKDIFHDPAKKEYWDKWFEGIFSIYGVTYSSEGDMVYKAWMSMRNEYGTGAVCGGISKLGTHIRAAHGTPASVISQPGHAAIIYYRKNADGKGYWTIDNDVSGWAKSGKTERLSIRMPLGWGNDSYVSGYPATYIVLAQEAMNDNVNYEKSEKTIMLAKVYSGDQAKQEQLYRKALEQQVINIDAWWGLINLYKNDSTKTEADYYNLAKELGDALMPFPLPMKNLLDQIKVKFLSPEYKFKYTLLETKLLTDGKNYTSTDVVLQPSITRTVASYLLGLTDTSLASFSFDGTDAGKIILSSRFDGNGIRWEYSLDGKQTWKEVSFTAEEEHKLQLTPEEISSITAENDICINIVGVNRVDENIYTIDITKGTIPTTIFANDLENRVVGATTAMEWRMKETDNWTSYKDSSPDLVGDKTVQVRVGATGRCLPSDVETYTFTEDNQPDTRKYIPVSHLSIQSVSTEATSNAGHATNAIDGNYNTRFHSAWNGTDTQRFIVIKLDKELYISAVEFVPAGGGNGKIIKGTVYGSMTGEDDDWVELANNSDAPFSYPTQANTNEEAIKYTKSFEIAEPQKVQYIKIVANQTNGNWFTAREFNLYQDITIDPHPTAGIAYSTTEPTNENVIARLVNPSKPITITKPEDGSDTYIFTENGEFTFEFVDADGNKGTALAKVDWIDKSGPTADVSYDLDPNKKLVILLENISEDVYLLDDNNQKINFIEVEKVEGENEQKTRIKSISYLDNAGNVYKKVDFDENGNTTRVVYKNTTGMVTDVQTYITTYVIEDNKVIRIDEEFLDEFDRDVTLTDAEKEELSKLRNTTSNPLECAIEESGEYEFKIQDKANNIVYKSIKVDYINNDKTILASDLTYDITTLTNKNVTATIKPFIINTEGEKDARVVITSGNGENTHVFEDNGEYEFKYKDEDDTENWEVKSHIARVSWIDKVPPTAEVTYSTTEETEGNVVATLVNESEEITIMSNAGNRAHTFTENGNFEFKFVDNAGNEGTVVAKVTWIKEKQEEPNPPVEEPDVTLGDIDGNGEINSTDLLRLQRHLMANIEGANLPEWILKGNMLKAANVDGKGTVNGNDLIALKRLIIKELEIKLGQ